MSMRDLGIQQGLIKPSEKIEGEGYTIELFFQGDGWGWNLWTRKDGDPISDAELKGLQGGLKCRQDKLLGPQTSLIILPLIAS